MADTIVAPATAPVTSAIGVIRMSGPDAAKIAESVFFPFSGRKLTDTPRLAQYGELKGELVIDRCVAVYFAAPKSYTGEDIVEFSLHGGGGVMRGALSLLTEKGARMASPGEFTRRAYANGKLTLFEAEAVADLIEAETPEAAANAAGQLSGALGAKFEQYYDRLLDITALFTASIDYVSEGVDPPDLKHTENELSDLAKGLKTLADSFDKGRYLSEGVRAVIAGRPNVGKSSVLNALSGRDRAIVSDIPGTTRDTLEQTVYLGGVKVVLTDTAGLRATDDPIESLGVKRAEAELDRAALFIAVFDGSRPLEKEDHALLDRLRSQNKPVIAALNKSDLGLKASLEGALSLSALTGEGIDALAQAIKDAVGIGGFTPDGSLITNRRQADALARAAQSCALAAQALKEGFTADVAWVDADAALAALGELTGQNTSEQTLTRVFERFCLGK